MQKSFTLIELLVVIAIIGILAGTIIVNMSGATDKATIAKSQSFASSVRSALGAGMVSEYRFDGIGIADGNNATTDYFKDTWNQNHGVVPVLTPTIDPPIVRSGTDCISNSCLEFYNQCISVSDNSSLDFGSEITTMTWVKVTSSQTATLIAQGDLDDADFGWRIGINNDINIDLSDDGTNYISYYYTTPHEDFFLDDKWHLIGFTWNSGVLKMYVDGDSVSYATEGALTTNIIHNTSQALNIGCSLFSGSKNWELIGSLDNVQLYNKAIPVTQIKSIYYAGLNNLLANKQITDEEYFTRISKLEQHSASN